MTAWEGLAKKVSESFKRDGWAGVDQTVKAETGQEPLMTAEYAVAMYGIQRGYAPPPQAVPDTIVDQIAKPGQVIIKDAPPEPEGEPKPEGIMEWVKENKLLVGGGVAALGLLLLIRRK